MSQWRWAVENRCVFIVRLKALSDRSGGRIIIIIIIIINLFATNQNIHNNHRV